MDTGQRANISFLALIFLASRPYLIGQQFGGLAVLLFFLGHGLTQIEICFGSASLVSYVLSGSIDESDGLPRTFYAVGNRYVGIAVVGIELHVRPTKQHQLFYNNGRIGR